MKFFFESPGMSFWISITMVRPKHECEKGCAVLIEHITCLFPLSVYSGKNIP